MSNEVPATPVVPVTPASEPTKAPKTPSAAPTPAPEPEKTPEEKRAELADATNRFRQVAREEARIQAQRRELKAQQAEYEKLRAQVAEIDKAKAEAKRDPLAFMEKHGLTYDDVTQFVLNDKRPTPSLEVKEVREELESIRAEIREREEAAAAERREAEEAAEVARRESYAATINEFKEDLGEFIKGKGEEYELINLWGEHELVYNTIEQYHARTGKILTMKEAADVVEAHLLDTAEKATATKKLLARMSAKKDSEGQRKAEPAQPRTMTGELTPSTPAYSSDAAARSEKDRMARALRALESGGKA